MQCAYLYTKTHALHQVLAPYLKDFLPFSTCVTIPALLIRVPDKKIFFRESAKAFSPNVFLPCYLFYTVSLSLS